MGEGGFGIILMRLLPQKTKKCLWAVLAHKSKTNHPKPGSVKGALSDDTSGKVQPQFFKFVNYNPSQFFYIQTIPVPS